MTDTNDSVGSHLYTYVEREAVVEAISDAIDQLERMAEQAEDHANTFKGRKGHYRGRAKAFSEAVGYFYGVLKVADFDTAMGTEQQGGIPADWDEDSDCE